ncbi:PhzF family phenazine biosynthesis protein [Flavobacterium sp.]|uniref:PhzF family phenazine biosynthesis protein n=1 Tax=Flavobacterium sp. TaxID=239 RepID=UPI004047DA21
MKELKIYQIDTFTDKVFSGNPAAVCPLENWLEDETMLKIAAENNLSETAFYVKNEKQFEIRWFTPTVEVDLCGHATLATAFVLFNFENYNSNKIEFYSPRSGNLTVRKDGDWLTLNFPSDQFNEVELSEELKSGFNFKPTKAFKGKTDYLLRFENEQQIKDIETDFSKIAKVNARGIIITARGEKSDFVSRFFAPQVGVNEDPVCGSAHTFLTPYWSAELNKNELTAIQLSDRKGFLKCKNLNKRVELSGQAKLYLKGIIEIE